MSFGKIFKTLVRLAIYVVIYVLLTWLFLGLTPRQTYNRFMQQMNAYFSGAATFTSDFADTTSKFSRVAGQQLNEASDRIQGVDPYERQNSEINRNIHNNLGQ